MFYCSLCSFCLGVVMVVQRSFIEIGGDQKTRQGRLGQAAQFPLQIPFGVVLAWAGLVSSPSAPEPSSCANHFPRGNQLGHRRRETSLVVPNLQGSSLNANFGGMFTYHQHIRKVNTNFTNVTRNALMNQLNCCIVIHYFKPRSRERSKVM